MSKVTNPGGRPRMPKAVAGRAASSGAEQSYKEREPTEL